MRLMIFALAIGCGSPRMSEAIVGKAPELSAEEARGEVVFMHKCNMCHPQGEGGLGGALNSKPFPATMIKAKVRGLVPGDMPKFSEEDIPGDDLNAIGAYLKRIRKNDN